MKSLRQLDLSGLHIASGVSAWRTDSAAAWWGVIFIAAIGIVLRVSSLANREL